MTRLRQAANIVCLLVAVTASMALWLGVADADPQSSTVPPSGVSVTDRFGADIGDASRRFGVPAAWIASIMRVESLGDPLALSPKGAIGLMQIMPETYEELRGRYGLGADPYAPHDNILAGAAFIRALHDRYGVPGFLAAYSAGPSRYEDHLATGRPLPAETRRYVAIVAPMLDGAQIDERVIVAADPLAWTRSPLFMSRADNQPVDKERSADLQSNRPSPGRPAVDPSAMSPQSGGLFVRQSTEVGRHDVDRTLAQIFVPRRMFGIGTGDAGRYDQRTAR